MAVKVAINGFGRIGRLALRVMSKNKDFDVVAINDLTDAKTLAHLFKYDSAQGRFDGTIEVTDDGFIVNGDSIKVFAKANPEELPWGDLGVDVVLECTGFFTSKEKAEAHIKAGAKKVVISAPATGDLKTVVYNVNDKWLRYGKGEMFIESKESHLAELSKQYALDDMEVKIVEAFLELSPDKRAAIKEYVSVLAKSFMDKSEEEIIQERIDKEVEEYRRELELEARVGEKSSHLGDILEAKENKKEAK